MYCLQRAVDEQGFTKEEGVSSWSFLLELTLTVRKFLANKEVRP